VYGYGKEAGIPTENEFFIFTKHMKKQNMFKVDITHTQ
jgi:hypothetical protein